MYFTTPRNNHLTDWPNHLSYSAAILIQTATYPLCCLYPTIFSRRHCLPFSGQLCFALPCRVFITLIIEAAHCSAQLCPDLSRPSIHRLCSSPLFRSKPLTPYQTDRNGEKNRQPVTRVHEAERAATERRPVRVPSAQRIHLASAAPTTKSTGTG